MTGEQFEVWIEGIVTAVASGPGKGGLVKFPFDAAIAELSDDERTAVVEKLGGVRDIVRYLVDMVEQYSAFSDALEQMMEKLKNRDRYTD